MLDLGIFEEMLKEAESFTKDMKKYYPHSALEVDPSYPTPKGKPIQVTIFVDADHATDLVNCKSITGIIILLGYTPYKWISKRQTCISTSTFGAEFAAMRMAVEEAIAITDLLKSIGIPVMDKARILGDNKGVIDNASIPGSALKKKHTSIAYHKVRECIALDLCEIFHIKGTDNPADILTKALSNELYYSNIFKLMFGQSIYNCG